MLKRTIFAAIVANVAIVLAVSCCCKTEDDYPFTIAHRGCWLSPDAQFTGARTFVVTENSLEAVRMAARYGYKSIELDPKFTRDSVIVVMHDNTINRTMVRADGTEIPEQIRVSDLSFEDLRSNYILRGMNSPVPTLVELLAECRDCGILPLMHCDNYEGYLVAEQVLGDGYIAFSTEFDVLRKVRAMSPCKILLDPSHELENRGLEETPGNVLALLDEIGGDTGISSMKHDMCSAEMCKALRAEGHDVQSSIFQSPAEIEAIRNGVTILLTDYAWSPSDAMKPAETKKFRTGDGIEWHGQRYEFGALTVEMEGRGEWELNVCGERDYTISHETSAKDIVSLRYYDRSPSVLLTVNSGKVKVKIKNYSN